jgi:hypothetical protein
MPSERRLGIACWKETTDMAKEIKIYKSNWGSPDTWSEPLGVAVIPDDDKPSGGGGGGGGGGGSPQNSVVGLIILAVFGIPLIIFLALIDGSQCGRGDGPKNKALLKGEDWNDFSCEDAKGKKGCISSSQYAPGHGCPGTQLCCPP